MVLSLRYFAAALLAAPVVVVGNRQLVKMEVAQKAGSDQAKKCYEALGKPRKDGVTQKAIDEVWRLDALEGYKKIKEGADIENYNKALEKADAQKPFTDFKKVEADQATNTEGSGETKPAGVRAMMNAPQEGQESGKGAAKECNTPDYFAVPDPKGKADTKNTEALNAFVKKVDELHAAQAKHDADKKAGAGKAKADAATSANSAGVISMVGVVSSTVLAALLF